MSTKKGEWNLDRGAKSSNESHGVFGVVGTSGARDTYEIVPDEASHVLGGHKSPIDEDLVKQELKRATRSSKAQISLMMRKLCGQ